MTWISCSPAPPAGTSRSTVNWRRSANGCGRSGFLERAELDALISGAAVFCYPSTREGFGLPVLEAMAQGTPVVTSRGTATEEVAGDAARLVDPFDVDAIATALHELVRDPADAARLGEAGRERAAQFTWEHTADLTVPSTGRRRHERAERAHAGRATAREPVGDGARPRERGRSPQEA